MLERDVLLFDAAKYFFQIRLVHRLISVIPAVPEESRWHLFPGLHRKGDALRAETKAVGKVQRFLKVKCGKNGFPVCGPFQIEASGERHTLTGKGRSMLCPKHTGISSMVLRVGQQHPGLTI